MPGKCYAPGALVNIHLHGFFGIIAYRKLEGNTGAPRPHTPSAHSINTLQGSILSNDKVQYFMFTGEMNQVLHRRAI